MEIEKFDLLDVRICDFNNGTKILSFEYAEAELIMGDIKNYNIKGGRGNKNLISYKDYLKDIKLTLNIPNFKWSNISSSIFTIEGDYLDESDKIIYKFIAHKCQFDESNSSGLIFFDLLHHKNGYYDIIKENME